MCGSAGDRDEVGGGRKGSGGGRDSDEGVHGG